MVVKWSVKNALNSTKPFIAALGHDASVSEAVLPMPDEAAGIVWSVSL